MSLYFSCYQLIPLDRTAEILKDLFGLQISPGTIANFIQKAGEGLKPWEVETRKKILTSSVTHFDETGMRCEGQTDWLHVVSTREHTLFVLNASRSHEAIEAIGILPEYQGTAVHDGFKSYQSYSNCRHSLCDAHHIRELKFIHEVKKEAWAKTMKELLYDAHSHIRRLQLQGKRPTFRWILSVESRYEQILKRGYRLHGEHIDDTRGRPMPRYSRKPGLNLLNRLRDQKSEVLLFVRDPEVPFTNNAAEQDIRMMKVKQKISGSFRAADAAESFCRIRSYLSTQIKQGKTAFKSVLEINI